MSGGHGGFSGGSAFSGHAFSGAHSSAGLGSRSFNRGSSQRGFSQRGSSQRGLTFRNSSRSLNSRRSFNRNGNLRLRTYGLRNNCFGYACRGFGSPWGYAGFYDPYWFWDSGSSYDNNGDQQGENGLANEMNQQGVDEQSQRQQDDQGSYAQSTPPRHQPERTEAAPSTVLVFRDQHKQEVQNYAIVGETLWNFAPQRTEKIPLDNLDIPATTKTNEDRGVDFRVPVTMGRLTLQIQSVD